MNILQFQKELDTVALEWNLHRISSSRNSVCSKGRPFIMYHIPQIYDTYDYLQELANEDIDVFNPRGLFADNIPCDRDVYDLCNIIMNENAMFMTSEPFATVELYTILRQQLLNIL